MSKREPTAAGALMVYDDACRKLAEAARVDEVKHIRDAAFAMAAYARQAKNREVEADAVAIRMRATRRRGGRGERAMKFHELANSSRYGGHRF